ncbi:MAG TPA: hypothetical protein VKE70_36370 [Candidatus Solibacter sp.]|nr:hypothetical protein [Candidatus Solibacter sp.]
MTVFSISILLEQDRPALPARHRGAVGRRNTFHLSPVRGFLVARIAQDHAVDVQGVQVALSTSFAGH